MRCRTRTGREMSARDAFGVSPGTSRQAAIVGLVAVGLVCGAPAVSAQEAMEVHVVDVGPGLCTVTEVPDGHYIVYDAGHWQGRRCIRAVEEIVEGEVIDLMVISHSDSDHLGDADEILARYDVQRIVWTGHRRPGTANWERMNEALAEEVARTAATVRAFDTAPLVPGESITVGPATVTFLAGWGRWTESGPTASERRNVISVVTRIEYDGKAVLYTGDTIGRRRNDDPNECKDAEQRMVQDHDAGVIDLRSDVIIAPHHGGDNGSTECFIARVDPDFVVFSAGHQHDHPTSAAANRYLAHGVPITSIFRTDRGDDEGGFEWPHLSVPGCRDPRGDDDVVVRLPLGGAVQVSYREPSTGC